MLRNLHTNTKLMGFQGESRLDCQSTATGLVLHSCSNIKSLLSTASKSQLLSSPLRDAAVQYLEAPVIPYTVIRDIWVQLTPGYGVPFHQVLAGSSFVLESPKPREKVRATLRYMILKLQSKELKERLAKLQENAEKQAYSELVKDVVKHEEEREYFSSYKNSLGFGIHVIFIMFTGYMFGYALVRSQFPDSPAMHAAGGVFGLIVGMFVETILFITRVSMTEKRSEMKEKLKLKAEQSVLQSSAEPTLPLSAETPSLLSEIQLESEAEVPFGIRKRRAPAQYAD